MGTDDGTATPWHENLSHAMTTGMFIFVVITAYVQFNLKVPMGKFIPSNPSAWGPRIPAPLGWLMESPVVYICLIALWKTEFCNHQIIPTILIGLLVLHYINRSIVYPLRMACSVWEAPLSLSKMPLVVSLMACFFCVYNATLQSLSLCVGYDAPHKNKRFRSETRFLGAGGISGLWGAVAGLRFCLGIVLFISGMYINISSDNRLFKLKALRTAKDCKDSSKTDSSSRYGIPEGGMFEYVSAANYFGEIVEWTGWAIACGPHVTSAWAFAFFSACFLIVRGMQHHQFYQRTFKSYPAHRKAVIPFIL